MWKAVLRGVVVACVALGIAGAAVAEGEAFEIGVDRPGDDIRDFAVGAGAEDCQAVCQAHDACRAWTYVGDDPPHGPGHCWLKDAVPDARPMATAVSGVVGLRLAVAHWGEPRSTRTDVGYADLVVRTGDIDNLGFGWPTGFNPFTGRATPRHAYPWTPEADDPAGTDRIMVGTGYQGEPRAGQDGYADATQRPANAPEAVTLSLPADPPKVERVLLQLFVDDFQAPTWGGHYRVTLDGQRIPAMETALNALDQTGPIGKLISLPLLPEHHAFLADGELEVAIDDPSTGAGDGYAIDFARLLINPRDLPHTVRLSGRVTAAATGRPLPGALVTSALAETESGADGGYALVDLPAGLVVVRAGKAGYETAGATADIVSGESARVDLALKRREDDVASLADALEREGRARLSGIYFDLNSADLRPASEQTLQAVRAFMRRYPGRGYAIEGHTDSQGGAAYNRRLSRQRAEAVVAWLTAAGVAAGRLQAIGHGESRPVADNTTAAGRALNRRVEITRRP